MTRTVAPSHCARLYGGGVRDCICMVLPHHPKTGGGFLECPPEARGILGPVPVEPPLSGGGGGAAAPSHRFAPGDTVTVTVGSDAAVAERPIRHSVPIASLTGYTQPLRSLTGDICASCGSPNMVRTGTCLTCGDCGDSSGGCS